jgi:hypothetical protein
MQVVYVDDVGDPREVCTHVDEIEIVGRSLKENMSRVAEKPPRRIGHECDYEKRSDRVGPLPVRHHNDDAGDRRGDEGEEVGEDVQVGAADVETSPVGFRKHRDDGDVDHGADEGDDEHEPAVDVQWVYESLDRLDADEHRDGDQGDAVDGRREDLGALQTEGPATLGGAAGQANPRAINRNRLSPSLV